MITQAFLAKVDLARLQKAARGLQAGTLQVLLEGRTDGAVWGLVRNGEEKVYSVQVAGDAASCSCPDSTFRKTICKHALALALYAIDHPEDPTERKPDLSLRKMRSEAEREHVRREIEEMCR
jgi:uncharacterized Zn finger protein